MQWIADERAGTFSTTIHKTDSGNELVRKVVAKRLAAFKLQGIKSYCPRLDVAIHVLPLSPPCCQLKCLCLNLKKMWSYRIFAWARVPLLSVMRCRGAMSRVCRSWCRSAVLPAQSVNAVPIYKNTSILNRNLGNWKFYIRNMSRKGRKNIRRFQNILHSIHTLTRKTGLGQLFKKNT